MNLHLPHAALLETLRFTGLSGEQALLATLVSQNPSTHARTRTRARALLLLNEGATVVEAAYKALLSRRGVVDLIRRFSEGGLCHALLGPHATQEQKVWLNLSPSSPERVQLAFPELSARKSSTISAASREGFALMRADSARPSCRPKTRQESGPHHAAVLAR
ncbi:helix-turn-helix domain-containing protein [Brevifollis gellanilyticus]|uniref:helix-turn-helix domain-containing protein n=1 Tax=Brevifollis gellanilyticus TaxID=748831 RepID=UPI0014789588|nr:helix-turn-helix domain-containing protein [Brevifollis gellanilyticus]